MNSKQKCAYMMAGATLVLALQNVPGVIEAELQCPT